MGQTCQDRIAGFKALVTVNTYEPETDEFVRRGAPSFFHDVVEGLPKSVKRTRRLTYFLLELCLRRVRSPRSRSNLFLEMP
jgi:hypothetical protein